ncbi:MAG: MerC family mercury resistance protein, partial [Gammaproteobacteria bacterium]|nr:MerC family mercury resistance protein [Gammaproteobacteria bacterium]
MPITDTSLRKADRFGFAASFLCALHCALLPLAAALLPALGLNVGGWIDFDQAFVVFATVLGVTTLTVGYRRHRAFRAWALLVPGLAMV